MGDDAHLAAGPVEELILLGASFPGAGFGASEDAKQLVVEIVYNLSLCVTVPLPSLCIYSCPPNPHLIPNTPTPSGEAADYNTTYLFFYFFHAFFTFLSPCFGWL